MYNLTGVGTLLAIIGYVAFIDPGVADAQIEGAVQYPPPSISEDSQPLVAQHKEPSAGGSV